jgi:hypothetical protein
MLLRGMTEHVKAQNWMAVGLDFVIVVLAVFIGIQVSNWNEGRKELRKEDAYLARLDAEMDVIMERLEGGLLLYRQSTEAAALLLEARRIHRGEREGPLPEDATLREAMRMLRAGRVPAGSPAAFREMVSSGELTILRSEALRDALFRYDEFAAIARDVWRTGRDEFLLGYAGVAPLFEARVDFDVVPSLNPQGGQGASPYAVQEFHRNRFFEDDGSDGALEIIQGANANLYEVVHMQRALAREIEPLIAWERAR